MNGSEVTRAAEESTVQAGLPHRLQTHIGPLDGLRGLAATIVVFSHMGFSGLKPLLNAQIGNYGVFLFFVLSGFLMGHLYIAKDFNRDRFLTYFAARISRIVPIYYIVVTISFLYGIYVDPDFTYSMDLTDFVRHLAFVGNISVFWSIGPEFQFYFVFPLAWWIVNQNSEKALMWGICATFFILVIILYRSEWPGILVLSKIHIFLAGILLGALRPLLVGKISEKVATLFQILATLILFILLLPHNLVGEVIYPGTVGDIKNNNYYADFAKLFLLSFVVCAFSFSTGFARIFLENRLARMVGKYSFSVYLLHVPVLYAFQHLGISGALPYGIVVPMVLATVVLVSGLSFHLLENPTRIVARAALMRLFRVRPH